MFLSHKIKDYVFLNFIRIKILDKFFLIRGFFRCCLIYQCTNFPCYRTHFMQSAIAFENC